MLNECLGGDCSDGPPVRSAREGWCHKFKVVVLLLASLWLTRAGPPDNQQNKAKCTTARDKARIMLAHAKHVSVRCGLLVRCLFEGLDVSVPAPSFCNSSSADFGDSVGKRAAQDDP